MMRGRPKDAAVPEFAVIFKGDSLQPQASIAPEGDVTFIVQNSSGEAHDFALVGVPDTDHSPPEVAEPLEEEHIAVVGRLMGIEPGQTEVVTFPLERGSYLMISNTPGRTLGASLFELTVQPVDGEGEPGDH